MEKVDFEAQERALHGRAAKFRASTAAPGSKHQVVNKVVDIFSDGVRMSGTIWRPENAPPDKQLLPAILLCHGWGGKRAHLDFSYAPKFAAAGFVVLTFDYRGWGESDGIVVAAEAQPKPEPGGDGTVSMRVRVVRKVIDPEWQLRDVDSALNYLLYAVPGVDISRVGIWGSSFGGGHALATGARDSRIKCIVCQIGSINTHANWINRHPQYRGAPAIHRLAAEQAQGITFPWTLQMPAGLDGAPNLPKVVFEHTDKTISSLDRIQAPTLILAAEKEELFRNEQNSELVYERLKGRVPAQLDYLPGGHYDAYGNPAYGKGLQLATDWFKLYLSNPDPKL